MKPTSASLFLRRVSNLFWVPIPVPVEYRKIFHHMYMDMAGMGVLSGSTMAFLAVYATRQGAVPGQIGLLSAVPGLINLLFALPVGNWLSKQSMGKTVFWASILSRIFYLVLVPLPVILLPHTQVWVIIFLTFVMTIPGTAVVVGFNAMFAEMVPAEWRGHVVGIRNALLSVTATASTLISGQILGWVHYPIGYQIVFVVGFLGASFSCFHLYFLANHASLKKKIIQFDPDFKLSLAAPGRRIINELDLLYRRGVKSLRLDVIKGPYGKIMGLLFFWHLAQFMAIPCVTLFIVNQLKINDQLIGVANGLFNMTVFLGSIKLSQVAARFGNKRLTGVGILFLSLFPILTSFGVATYILANIIGGLAWSMASGGLYNYILENVPGNDRPAYLAWYNLVSNAAILIGSLAGPAAGGVIGLSTAMVIFGICRFLAGAAILRWG